MARIAERTLYRARARARARARERKSNHASAGNVCGCLANVALPGRLISCTYTITICLVPFRCILHVSRYAGGW